MVINNLMKVPSFITPLCFFRCFGMYWYHKNKKSTIFIRKYQRKRSFL